MIGLIVSGVIVPEKWRAGRMLNKRMPTQYKRQRFPQCRISKKGSRSCLFCLLRRWRKSACCLSLGTAGTELLAEFFNAASGVNDLVLTSKERMGFRRYFELDEGVILAFEINGFAGLDGGTGNEFEVVGHVLEYDFAVIRVNAFFHDFLN
jgi:hypothetical protein